MSGTVTPTLAAVRDRLDRCYSGGECNWDLFYRRDKNAPTSLRAITWCTQAWPTSF
jgi:hypothetical protein